MPLYGPEETEQTLLARLDERMSAVQRDVSALRAEFHKYVTKHEFAPVKLIAFGLAALVLATTVSALMSRLFIR